MSGINQPGVPAPWLVRRVYLAVLETHQAWAVDYSSAEAAVIKAAIEAGRYSDGRVPFAVYVIERDEPFAPTDVWIDQLGTTYRPKLPPCNHWSGGFVSAGYTYQGECATHGEREITTLRIIENIEPCEEDGGVRKVALRTQELSA